ncbi:MAG: 3'-5' exonuclease [Gemmatimonadetes bacterium]|nr:3'-5' exonuclease [Gemmatimonadota bacterium]NIQ52562.1 3'-5' exonuclease [Gemmatimonadota bacterium]NIU72700.1 3'-5' exonuclease [Gammaproteobacteria bacterium]NIX43106.1 3'-5' exonuclease [Gemmatimonadota bacterium]NIY07268.1 3'-5' exonuclease [Gemmatimonadota bacterium]
MTLWCLDLETGGLDPRSDPVLSVGMVPIQEGAVRLGLTFRSLVRPRRPVTRSSLVIHHILPRDLAGAPALEEVIPEIETRLEDGLLLVHQRSMDVPFLKRSFRRCGAEPPPFLVIDTVQLLLRYARRHGHVTPERTEFPTGLTAARARFGLPPHRAHEALSDAVATAELFLVLAHRLRATRVRHLL